MYHLWMVILLLLWCSSPIPQVKAEEPIIQQNHNLKQELLKTSEERANLEKELEKLDIELNEVVEQLRDIQQKIELKKQESADAKRQLDLINERLEKRKDQLNQRMVVLYEQNTTPLLMIFDALLNTKGFMDLLIRLDFVQLVIEQDSRLLEEYHLDYIQAKRYMTTLHQNLQDLEKLEENTRKTKEAYEAKSIERNMVLAQMIEREGGLAEILEEQEEMINVLMERFQDQSETTSEETLSSQDIWFWPISDGGVVTSLYGNRIDPITKEIKTHSGLDIASKEGTPILAVGKGKVVIARYQGGYGNLVAIDHGKGIVTLYAHIRHGGILVKEGQQVEAGEQIAEVGSTGRSTGPHLHFEVKRNGKKENPVYYLSTKVKSIVYAENLAGESK